MAACALTAVFEQTGVYTTHRRDVRNPFEKDVFVVNEEYVRVLKDKEEEKSA